MSQQYQVLARKYRPKNFHELVGQSHVSKALINAIDHNRLHHAYLFTGTRGVGKTTIARILSKCLNCETGITSTPCGVCSSCVAIDQGRFIDLIEIDAASRTKVEDTRELIDNVPYAPTQGRFKVYLIDEVHMLSTHSFNALLKTLEEPPSHVKFLLATTDPQKLPITIISRCLQFVLRPLPQQAITDHLSHLLTLEGVDYTQPALWQLANAAKGSVRDALSLTDQAIAFGQGQLTDETVNDMLGLIDSADLVSLLLDIYQGNTEAVSAHIEQMRAQMVDAGSMFDGLAELLHQIAMLQLLPNVALNVNDKQAEQINRLAHTIGSDVLQLYYQIVIQGREQIKLANTPLQALEMCLLRLLAFRPLAVNEVPIVPQSQPVANSDSLSNNSTVDSAATVPSNSTDLEADTLNTDSTDNIENTDINEDDEFGSQLVEPQQEQSSQSSVGSVELISDIDITNNRPENDYQSFDQDKNIKDGSTSALPSSGTVTANFDNENEQKSSGIEQKNEQLSEEQNSGSVSELATSPLSVSENDLQSPPSQTSTDIFDSNLDDIKSVSENADVGGIKLEQQALEKSNQLKATTEPEQIPPASEDPRSLLKCTPVELVGEWSPEKWDYWLQTARDSGALAFDQLAMARQGVMTGQISGQSVFKVAFDTKNMQGIFRHLADHLGEQFGAEVSIAVDTSLNSDCEDLLPQSRQKQREVNAKNLAKNLIIKSPVMQRLIHDSKGQISHLKLLDDTE